MSYPGAKGAAGVWQRIIGQMPPHKLYVEPFFGSGQVFYRKRAADWNILNDLDSTVDYKANLGPLGVAQNRLRTAVVDMLPPIVPRQCLGRKPSSIGWRAARN